MFAASVSKKGPRPSGLLPRRAVVGTPTGRSPGTFRAGGGGRSGCWPGSSMHDRGGGQHGPRQVRRSFLVDPARVSSWWMSWRGSTRRSRRADQAPKPHSLGRVSGGPCTGARGVCQARCSAGGKFGALRMSFHPLAAGAPSGSALADRGNGVLTGMSAAMLARCAAGVNRPGVSPPSIVGWLRPRRWGRRGGGRPGGSPPSLLRSSTRW